MCTTETQKGSRDGEVEQPEAFIAKAGTHITATMDSDPNGVNRISRDDAYRERSEVEAERFRSRTRSPSRSGSPEDALRGAGSRYDSDGSYSDSEADMVQVDEARPDPPTLNPNQRLKRRVASYVEDTGAPRVKFLCSIGGEIEHAADGAMRYKGGEKRLMLFYRNITYADLMNKITEHYHLPVSFKYQVRASILMSTAYPHL